MNSKTRIPNLKLDMSHMSKDATDILQASWNAIVSMSDENPFKGEMTDMSQKIIQYFASRFGFMWQPNSAMDVAPNEAKRDFVIMDGER